MTARPDPSAPDGDLRDGRPRAGVFVDAENVASGPALGDATFDTARVMAAVEAMARPIVRRAYADWGRLRELRAAFLRHGFDQIQTTYVNATKNALDMQLCCDAMELVLTGAPVDVVVLVTGDGDFGPLARALRRHGPLIVGIGWSEKTSDSLRAQCDRFLDYEDLAPVPAVPASRRAPQRPPRERRMIPVPADADDRPFLYDPRDGDAADDVAADDLAAGETGADETGADEAGTDETGPDVAGTSKT